MNNLDSIIGNLEKKQSLAKALKLELTTLRKQITEKLYKSVSQYLAIFSSDVRERDPQEEERFDQSIIKS